MTEASGFAILPAIDLREGRVVRLRQGDFEQETAYSDDPVAVAVRFAQAGARWLHVVDLDGARTGQPAHLEAIGSIVDAVGDWMAVEVAGGLRDPAAVAMVLASGAVRAIVGTAALQDPAFAGRLVTQHGADRIAVAIDVRDGRALGHGWSKDDVGPEAADVVERLADAGVTTFEVTAVDRDGLLGGPDLALYEQIGRLGAGSIIASGGITTLQDIRAVRACGCTGAIVGRAIYEGRILLSDLIQLADEPM